MALTSVIFDCLFWLFAFLRMGTIALTAQALGAGETQEIRAMLLRGLMVAARNRLGADRAADTTQRAAGGRHGRQ